jgi:hypothetical protein
MQLWFHSFAGCVFIALFMEKGFEVNGLCYLYDTFYPFAV